MPLFVEYRGLYRQRVKHKLELRFSVVTCVYSFYYINQPVDKPQLSYIDSKVHKTLSYKKR